MPKATHAYVPEIDVTDRSDTPSFASILDLEVVDFNVNNERQEWNPFDLGGWRRAIITGKNWELSCTAKRSKDSAGNDYLYGKKNKVGDDLKSILKITSPLLEGQLTAETIEIPVVIEITKLLGGSLDVAPLEFTLVSDGVPTVTDAT